MTMARTLQQHLDSKHIEYDLVSHPATASSIRTATACHVSADCIAKGVVLRAGDYYVLAVLPASHQLRRRDLEKQFGQDYALASERELDKLFWDCTRGAIPAVGECYGLDVLVEDSIRQQPEIYFEAGDHATLVHVTQAQFARLTGYAPHGHFTTHA